MATATSQHPSPEEREAARRYLEHDYAAMHLGGQPGREANRQAQEIDENHPRARDIALAGTERELGKLPKHLREHQIKSRQRAGIRQTQALELRKQFRSGPKQPDGKPDRGPRRRLLPGVGPAIRPARRYTRRAVRVAAGPGWGDLILNTILAAVMLSIGYLVLSKAAAASKLAEGASKSVRALVSPTVDPLNPKGVI